MDYEAEKTFKAALKVYVAQRVAQLLAEQAFSVRELTAIISQTLEPTIETGISGYVQDQLATKHLTQDRNGRLVKTT